MGKKKIAALMLAMGMSLSAVSVGYAAEQEETELMYANCVPEASYDEAWDGDYIPVLMYHHFAIRNMGRGNGVVTTVRELEDHLRQFQAAGYEVISLEKLDRILAQTEKDTDAEGAGLDLNKKYLCITMDDGYYSNYDLGYPLFRQTKTPVSIFAVTDFVTDQIGIQKFTWDQARKMEKSGLVKIYSHTADHQPVTAGEEEAFLESVQRSEAVLEENLTEERVKAISYPNGRYTEESQNLLEEDGYVLQFTVENGVITRETPRTALPRIMVSSGMTGDDVMRKIELAAERAFAAEREGAANEEEDHSRELENE